MKARLFKATLKRVRGTRIRRKVWRELAVPDRADLYRLSKGIVETFGLFFDHPFGFYDDLSDPYRAAQQYELFVDLGEEADAAGGAFERALAEAILALNVADRVAWMEPWPTPRWAFCTSGFLAGPARAGKGLAAFAAAFPGGLP